MKKFLLVPSLLLAFGLTYQATAQVDLTIVTRRVSEGETNLVNWLNANFGNIGSITLGRYDTGPVGIPAGNVVIMSRVTSSGDYDDAGEIAAWNGLSNDMLNFSAYAIRENSAQWGWASNSDIEDFDTTGNETALTAAGLSDPLFNGVTITGGAVDLFDNGSYNLRTGLELDFGGLASSFGGGDNLGSAVSAATNNLFASTVARWSAGDLPGIGGTAFGGDRIFIAGHELANTEPPSTGSGDVVRRHMQMDVYTADGEKVIINALTEFGLIVPEPSSVALLLGGGALLLVRRRRVS